MNIEFKYNLHAYGHTEPVHRPQSQSKNRM